MPEELKKHLINQPEDLRYEVLISELLNNQVIPPEQVRTTPKGIFHRGHNRDLEGFDVLRDAFDEITIYNFYVWREGLYDAIPEGIFHAPKNRDYKKSSKQIREEVQAQKTEEQAARDFFYPIEQEFYSKKILLEQEERDVFSGFSSESGRQLFSKDFWELNLPDSKEEQLTSLLYVLPLSFSFKGDLNKVETVFQTVLKTPVHFSLIEPYFNKISSSSFLPLGQIYLGYNSILSGGFTDEIPGIAIHIGPLEGGNLLKYLEGGSQYNVLQVLISFFLPVEAELEIKLNIKEPDCFFTLDESDYTARLGYSTTLNPY